MYHPTSRVLAVLELLQSKPSISGPELAVVLEVDVRTVRRYVTMLQDIGIPVEANTGRHGGYRLRPGFKLPPLMFTAEEATAITLGLLGTSRRDFGQSSLSIETALGKILRVLPFSVRDKLQAVSANMLYLAPHPEARFDGELVLNISTAISQHQRIEIEYSSAQEALTRRKVEPYGIVEWEDYWYLVGYCCLRQGFRNFRLDRIQAMEVQAEVFERVASFDCLAYLTEYYANMRYPWHFEVEFETALAPYQQARLTRYGTFTATPAGTLFVGQTQDLEVITRRLVGLGLPFVIHQPTELRQVLLKMAEQMRQIATASK